MLLLREGYISILLLFFFILFILILEDIDTLLERDLARNLSQDTFFVRQPSINDLGYAKVEQNHQESIVDQGRNQSIQIKHDTAPPIGTAVAWSLVFNATRLLLKRNATKKCLRSMGRKKSLAVHPTTTRRKCLQVPVFPLCHLTSALTEARES